MYEEEQTKSLMHPEATGTMKKKSPYIKTQFFAPFQSVTFHCSPNVRGALRDAVDCDLM